MKSLNIIIILFLVFNSMFAQEITKEMILKREAKIDSLTKIDFLSYKYTYLDGNFKIIMPKEVFDKTVINFKFYPERIKKYIDSLGVALMAEFKDSDAARIAELRINYQWKRVGYYAWMSENEVLALAKKLNVKMPYRLQELFLNNDPKVKTEIQTLRDKLFLQLGKEEIKTMSTKELLNYRFKYNPELIEIRKKGHQHKPQENK
ncbi:hypothetical protein NU08_1920 [Flavobacterium anhuiense]|uniref:Uncharacterized protein n=1 Tax=Flavobacterium anhuiense TaxID=459526 RepID=A0A444W023_9FLAO|nr:hypothetical protein [Flavobacterium anhuiense]RYJ39082.1 hypothetical protein NU08_1920 [Flavobacterium anhuiense]